MEIVSYNQWQKERLPLGPSFAVDAADLNRRLCRRHTPRVKASARSPFSSSAQFAHSRYGAEECSWGEGREKTLPHFKEMDLQKMLSEYLLQLQKEGNRFLKTYLDEVKSAALTEEEECELASIAIQTIEVDKSIEYNEVAFFKKIRKRLKSTDEKLLTAIPENPDVIDQIAPEDYLLPDITDEDDLSLWEGAFNDIAILHNN